MIERRAFLASLAAAAAVCLSSLPAEADEVAAAFEDIRKARAGLRTLVSRFTQERTIGLLATVVKSDGEMTIVRPDRLRWQLEPPDAITYWIGPEGFAFATPSGGASAGKAAAGRFGAVLGDLLALLGGDLEQVRARYDFSVARSAEGIVLTARPKAEEVKKYVSRLELATGRELWTVERVVIEEKSGDKSVIVFRSFARDVPVEPERMRPPRK